MHMRGHGMDLRVCGTCACDVEQGSTPRGCARRCTCGLESGPWPRCPRTRMQLESSRPRTCDRLSSRRGERAPRAAEQRGSLQHASARATAIAISETIMQRDHALHMSRSARATDPGLLSCGRRHSARPQRPRHHLPVNIK